MIFPIASDTRIARPGFMGPDGLIQLGSVASFLSEATPRDLRVPAVDRYKLRMGENGMLICDLFIEDKETRTSKVCSSSII